MSKIVETRICVGIEASGGEQAATTIDNAASTAQTAQAAFDKATNASKNFYAGIAEDSLEAQQALLSLTETFAKLLTEMQGTEVAAATLASC